MDSQHVPFVEEIGRLAEQVQKKYRLDSIYLYGSYAEGRQDEWSDVDLAIILDEPEAHSREVFSIGKDIHPDFDAFGFTKKDFLRPRRVTLYEIKEKGIKIWGRDLTC